MNGIQKKDWAAYALSVMLIFSIAAIAGDVVVERGNLTLDGDLEVSETISAGQVFDHNGIGGTSLYIAGEKECVTNGDFAEGEYGWSFGGSWEWSPSSESAVLEGVGVGGILQPDPNLEIEAGKTYSVSYYRDFSGLGGFIIMMGGITVESGTSASGYKSYQVTTDTNENLTFDFGFGPLMGSAEVDDVSVAEIFPSEIAGELNLTGEVIVDAPIDINGTLTVDGVAQIDTANVTTLSASTANIAALNATGTASAQDLIVSGEIETQDITVNNYLTVDNITGKTKTFPPRLGPELVTCEDFDCPFAWSVGDHWQIASSQGKFYASVGSMGGANGTLQQNVGVQQGHSYTVEFSLDTFEYNGATGSGAVTIRLGDTTVESFSGNSSDDGSGQQGVYTIENVVPTDGTGLLKFDAGMGCGPGGASLDIRFGYISVKEELPGSQENIIIDTYTTVDSGLDVTGMLTMGELVIPSAGSAPSEPVEGQMYIDTTEDKLRVYSGSAWRDIASW